MGNRRYRPAPGVCDGQPVPPDTDAGRLPGWKLEVWDGRLHLEPDWRHETARHAGRAPRARVLSGVHIGGLRPDDLAAAVAVADEAFTRGPDFFGVPAASQTRALTETTRDALTLEPEWTRRAHRIARTAGGEAVGLLLVREVAGGVALNTVSARPAWQRSGLATAMFASALAALPAGVGVRSQWLVANRESAAWHHAVGFVAFPTSVSAASWLAARPDRWTAAGRAAEVEVRRLSEAERAGLAPDPFRFAEPLHMHRAAAGSRSGGPA